MSENPYQSPTVSDATTEDQPQQQTRVGYSLNARDLLGVAARISGLTTLISAAWYLAFAFIATLGPRDGAGLVDYTCSGLTFLAAGLFLLRGAHDVVGFAYPGE